MQSSSSSSTTATAAASTSSSTGNTLVANNRQVLPSTVTTDTAALGSNVNSSITTVIQNTADIAAEELATTSSRSAPTTMSTTSMTNNLATNGHENMKQQQNGFTANNNNNNSVTSSNNNSATTTTTNINNNNNNNHITTVEVNLSCPQQQISNMTVGSSENLSAATTSAGGGGVTTTAAQNNHTTSTTNNIHQNNGEIATETATNATTTANNSTTTATTKTFGDNNGSNSNNAVTKNHNVKLDKSNQEIIRLIAQYLQDIGLEKSMKTLIAESGCYMEHPAATKFREHVLSGEWAKADADLKKLELLIDNGKATTITEMKFILLEQKYLEYLDDGRLLDALHVLRNELIPLQHNKTRMPQLSSFIMCTNTQTLHQCAKWDGKGILSRALVMDKLQAFMPPTVMMPPRRLRHLLQQAIEMQTQHCPCHDMAWETNLQNISLLTDHCCATDGFPMQTVQVLTEHCDEVWVCKFSPDGLKLATGCKDTTVIIWDLDPFTLQLKQRRTLDGQSQMSVAFVSWSPDSKMLLVGGPEDSSEICVWNVDDGQLVVKLSQSIEESLLCGAFNRDGTRFVCGGQRGQFYLCDLTGTILDSWEGVRVNSVAFRADNKTILAADNHYRIRGYNFENPRVDFDILKETHPIMTFSLNSTDRLALLNIANQGLHLWDIEDKCLVRRFQGIRQSNFTIYSCFGGTNESFVASGSEDKLVCIWHIKREEPLAKLYGHTKTVNCVSWNPVYPSLLASASDDATVRIWGPKNMPNRNATPESEESTSCSSSSSWNMNS